MRAIELDFKRYVANIVTIQPYKKTCTFRKININGYVGKFQIPERESTIELIKQNPEKFYEILLEIKPMLAEW